jgi:hypothetical membrane protein
MGIKKSIQCAHIIAIIAFFSFLLTFILSILLYRNYNFFNQYISELGIGETAIIFNSGLMITSIFLFILYYVLFKKQKLSLKKLPIAFVSSIGLFCVALFPLYLSHAHFISAGIFFFFSFILIIIFSFKKRINIFFALPILIYFFIQNPITQKIAAITFIIWILFISFS